MPTKSIVVASNLGPKKVLTLQEVSAKNKTLNQINQTYVTNKHKHLQNAYYGNLCLHFFRIYYHIYRP